MPTRVIREGMLTSERVDSLSELAELFYRRLQQVVDDHGRYFAHPTHLRTNCFPARMDRYTDLQVLGWRRECEAVGLVRVYQVGRLEYLELADFRQQIKSKSKFPAPVDGRPVCPPTPPCPTVEGADSPPVHDPCTDRARTVHDPCTLVVGEGEGEGGGAARAHACDPAPAHAREEPPPPLPPPPEPGPDPLERTGVTVPLDPIDPDRVVPIRAAERFDPGEPTREGVIAAWLIDRERAAGRQTRGLSAMNPRLRRWVEDGVTDAEIAEAYRLAVEARLAQADGSPLSIGFIDVKLRDLRAKAARPTERLPARPGPSPWERDTRSMLDEADRIGLKVNGQWTADDLRWHIRQRHRAQGRAA